MEKILDLGGEYRLKATREKVGNFTVVAIGWEHPNHCFDFSDAMIWVRSTHPDNWKPVPVVNWSKNYENLNDFLEDYPELTKFFKYRPGKEFWKTMLEGI